MKKKKERNFPSKIFLPATYLSKYVANRAFEHRRQGCLEASLEQTGMTRGALMILAALAVDCFPMMCGGSAVCNCNSSTQRFIMPNKAQCNKLFSPTFMFLKHINFALHEKT